MAAAPAGSVPTMEVLQASGASGETIHQMDASLLEVHSPPRVYCLYGRTIWSLSFVYKLSIEVV